MSYYTTGTDEGCLNGHYWHGSSQCSLCGARLRCECGQYMREDGIEEHMAVCRVLNKIAAANEADAASREVS